MTTKPVPPPDSGAAPEYDVSVKEYHFARARYIRAVTSGSEKRLLESVARRRGPLQAEIANLSALVRVRHAAWEAALRDYAAKAPRNVTATGLVAPSSVEGLGAIGKLYRAAVKAAAEFNEINDISKNRRSKLDKLDTEVRVVLEQHERDVIALLETPAGLDGALKRDPLLGRAHARMLAAAARRASIVQSMLPSEPDPGPQAPRQ